MNCGTLVVGDGYTNHCPNCLWSRHVDNFPGDRACECRGLMQPVSVECKAGEFRIIHRCKICGLEKPNRVSSLDDREVLINVSAGAGA